MDLFRRMKSRRSATDLAIIAAVLLFFVAGVFFEARRSDGRFNQIAPSVGAETALTSSAQSNSETQSEPEDAQDTAAADPTPTQAPTTAEPSPVPAGEPDPETVGQRVFLDLSGIENESVIEASEVTIVGTTTPDALLSINGQAVEVELNGSFSIDLVLDPGPNFVEIVSSNLRGQETSRVISVVSVQ